MRELAYEDFRKLRGEESREAFAVRLGLASRTVYRAELGDKVSRQTRGAYERERDAQAAKPGGVAA